jgi:hypothetical protein
VYNHENAQSIKPGRVEERGVVSDVVMPIAQNVVGGAVGGATGAWVANKLGGSSQLPQPKTDD